MLHYIAHRLLHYLGLTVVFLTTLNTLAVLVTLQFYYDDRDPKGTIFIYGNPDSPTWYTGRAENTHITLDAMFDLYIISLTTISGLAYAISSWTISPQKPITFYFFFFVVVVGFIFNNWVIVKLIATRSRLDANVVSFHNNLVRFMQYLKKADLSSQLKRSCQEYYEFLWLETEGVYQDKVFNAVHDTLKTDCLMAAYATVLQKVEIFSSLPPHCLRDIAGILKISYMCKNVNVLSINLVYNEIFILKSGKVDFYDTTGRLIRSLHPGSVFGNFGSGDFVKATSTFKTSENSTFLILKSKDLRQLGNKYDELLRLLNVLSLKKKLYVAGRGTTATAVSDVPVWILKFVDSTRYRSAKVFLYTSLMVKIIASFISIYHLAYDIPHKCYLIAIFFDIFLVFQLFLAFNTPYYDYRSRNFISVRRKIRHRTLRKHTFYLRAISCIPFYAIPFFLNVDDETKTLLFKVLNINKLIWVYLSLAHFNIFMKRVDINLLFLKSVQSIYILLLGVHVCTCLWQIVRCDRSKCYTISPTGVSYTICNDRTYFCNLYIVLQSLTTAGLGDVLPVNIKQMLVLTLFCIGGVFVMASFIGAIVDILDLMRLTYTAFSHQVSLYMTYLRINKISEWRISEHFKYCSRIWSLEEGKQMPLFAESLPIYLKRECNIQLYGRAFMNNFIFGSVPVECLKQMLVHVEREIFISNNVIVSKGQASESLYLILQGEVACMIGSSTVSVLYSGAFFGLRSGLFVNVRSMFTYVSLKTTYVIKLNQSSWGYLMDFFPSARAVIYFRSSSSNITPHPDYSDFIASSNSIEPAKMHCKDT